MLSGHTDVVPAGPGWATDPVLDDEGCGDALRGRGTADMKGFIAAMIRTIHQFRGVKLRRRLHLALSFDEEIGCVGVRDACSAVIAGSDDVSSRPRGDRRADHDAAATQPHGQARVRGRMHSPRPRIPACRTPSPAPSRSRATTRRSALDDLQQQYPAHRRSRGHVQLRHDRGRIGAQRHRRAMHVRVRGASHGRSRPRRRAAAVHATPSRRERAALADVDGSVDVTEITRYPALRTASNDPWLQVVERVADAGPATSIGFGTEGGLFAEALDTSVVICGPGDIAVAHRPDEYVTVDQLLRCERFLCGAGPTDLCRSRRRGLDLRRWRTRCLPMRLPPNNCSPRSKSSGRCGVNGWPNTIEPRRSRTRTWPKPPKPD